MDAADNILNGLRIVRFGPEDLPCAVDVHRARVYLGQHGHPLDGELEARFEAAVRDCESTARPRGMGRSFALDRSHADGIALVHSPLVLTGRNIARHLEGCTLTCLIAVTLGMESERTIARLQATNPLDALLFDACASSMAEEAAQAASRRIAGLADQAGLVPTKRFSPGFGDLPLDLQGTFLQTIDADKQLGIHAGPSHLMTPAKSVTAIVGLKPR
ncbi:MAG: hypothetical protein V8R08_01420 [Coriobacteriales bacterium]